MAAWPSVQGDVSLAYGHDGMGVFLPSSSPQHSWKLARAHNLGYRFNDIGTQDINQGVVLPEDEMEETNMDGLWRELRYVDGGFFPIQLAFESTVESNLLSSGVAFDPLIGDLVSSGRVISDHDDMGISVIAFPDGVRNDILCVGKLFAQTPSPLIENDAIVGSAVLPWPTAVCKLELGSRIKQICFAEPEPSISPVLLVRTEISLVLVRVSHASDAIELTTCLEISPGTDKFASAEFSHWDWSRVVSVSTVGEIVVHQLQLELKQTEQIFSARLPQNLRCKSPWHKVYFGDHVNRLIVVNSRSVSLLDFDISGTAVDYKLNQLIEFLPEDSDNVIYDSTLFPSTPSYLFVLTSNVITWLDINLSTRNLLSWEHNLSGQDPSLRINPTMVDDIYQIVISSILMPVSIVYQFKLVDDFPVSADDPYSIICPADSSSQGSTLIEVLVDEYNGENQSAKMLASFSVSRDNTLKRQLLSTSSDLIADEIIASSESSPQRMHSEEHLEDLGVNIAPKPDILYMDFRQVYQYLFTTSITTTSDGTEYARILGDKVNRLFESTKRSIKTLGEVELGILNHPEELQQIIDQLSEHYQNTSIDIRHLVSGTGTLFGEDFQKDSDIARYLTDLWCEPLAHKEDVPQNIKNRRLKLAKYISAELYLSCTGVHVDRTDKTVLDDQENPVSYLQKFVDGTTASTPLNSATQLLVEEWSGEVDNYKWSKLGDEQGAHAKARFSSRKSSAKSSQVSSRAASPAILAEAGGGFTLAAMAESSQSISASQPIMASPHRLRSTPRSSARPFASSGSSQLRRKKKKKEGFA